MPAMGLKFWGMKFGIIAGFIMPGIGMKGMPGIDIGMGIFDMGKFMFGMFCIIVVRSAGMNELMGRVVAPPVVAGTKARLSAASDVSLDRSPDFSLFIAGAAPAPALLPERSSELRLFDLAAPSTRLDEGDMFP